MLKSVIHWIAQHGVSAYDAHKIADDLKISIDYLPISAESAVKLVFDEGISKILHSTNMNAQSNADELFDTLLTFFEHLAEYKASLKQIFNQQTLSLRHLDFLPLLNKTSHRFFKSDIKTFLDKATYSLIFAKLFYTWIHDNSQELATTTHAINQTCQAIYNTL